MEQHHLLKFLFGDQVAAGFEAADNGYLTSKSMFHRIYPLAEIHLRYYDNLCRPYSFPQRVTWKRPDRARAEKPGPNASSSQAIHGLPRYTGGDPVGNEYHFSIFQLVT